MINPELIRETAVIGWKSSDFDDARLTILLEHILFSLTKVWLIDAYKYKRRQSHRFDAFEKIPAEPCRESKSDERARYFKYEMCCRFSYADHSKRHISYVYLML